MRLSFGNFACGMEMEIIPAISVFEHRPERKAPLKSSEEKEAPVHTMWSPACSPNAEMQPVWYHLSVTTD